MLCCDASRITMLVSHGSVRRAWPWLLHSAACLTHHTSSTTVTAKTDNIHALASTNRLLALPSRGALRPLARAPTATCCCALQGPRLHPLLGHLQRAPQQAAQRAQRRHRGLGARGCRLGQVAGHPAPRDRGQRGLFWAVTAR